VSGKPRVVPYLVPELNSRSRLGLCHTALRAISAHIKTYVKPNPKVFAINRASAAAEDVKIGSES